MSAEDGHGSDRHFIKVFYKECSLLPEILYDMAIMDDFMEDEDRRTVYIECPFDNLDGTNNACAETARFEQQDPLLTRGSPSRITVGDGFKGCRSHFAIISTR